MAKAQFNGVVVAESDETVVVDGSRYFPPESVNHDVLTASDRTTRCSWKGEARYHDLTVGDETAENAAWHYPDALEAAADIRGHLAFYSPPVSVSD